MEKAKTKIFLPTRFDRDRIQSLIDHSRVKRQSGFTLIEVMIVVVILAGMSALVLSRFDRKTNELKSMIRKLTVLSKELHTAARLNNRVYRMVIQMNEEGNDSISVESAARGTLLGKSAFYKSKDDLDDEKENKDEETPPPPFQPDTQIIRRPIEVPKPIRITEVEVSGQEESFKNGMAFLYFFPEGLTQESAIHIGDGEKLNWTIAIHPLTGQGRIVSEKKSLKELKVEP